MLIQPPTAPRAGTASDSGSATIPSTEPQGRWGCWDVSGDSGVASLLPDNPRDGTLANDKIKGTQQSSSLQHRKPASTAALTGQLPSAAALLGALSGLAAVGLAATNNRNSDSSIAVADAETLGKIGRDPDYPLNGNYRQTVAYIDGGQLRQSIGNDTHPFTGTLHGEKGTIGNLRNCLVKTMAGEGRIDSLCFTDASITSTGPTAVVACKISENATVSNIRVEMLM